MPISPKSKRVAHTETKVDKADVDPIARRGRWIIVTLRLEVFILIMRLMVRNKLYDIQLYNVVFALSQRFQDHDTPEDLDKDRKLCRVALPLYPPTHPLCFQMLSNFAAIIVSLLFALGDDAKTEDLNEAITVLRNVLPAKSLSSTNRLNMTIIMARSFKLRYVRLRDAKDLEAAIKHFELVVELCPPLDMLERSAAHYDLALALQHRPKDENDAHLAPIIHNLRQGHKLLPYGDFTRSKSAVLLCKCLELDHQRTGDYTTTSEIAELQKEVLDHYPVEDPSRLLLLLEYGRNCFSYFTHQNSLTHLNAAHDYLNQALSQITPDQVDERARVHLSLTSVYKGRSTEFGQKEDADHGVEHAREALKLCPPGHPLHSQCLGVLTSSLLTRYSQSGDPDDLQESIRCGRANLELLPPDNDNPIPLIALCRSLQDSFSQQLGDINNVNQAIELARKGVALARSKVPHALAPSLDALAMALRSRYQQVGEMADLDNAIEHFREAVQALEANAPTRPDALCNLSDTLVLRYTVLQDFDDLGESLEYLSQAIHLIEPNHRKSAGMIGSLAMQHQHVVSELIESNPEHLDQTVSMFRLAVERSPESEPHHVTDLSNLAWALKSHGMKRENVEDLNEAIRCLDKAIKYPSPWMGLYVLGCARLARFELVKDIRDLDEAAVALHRAEENVPEHLALRGLISNALAQVYEGRGSPPDIEKAFAYLDKAVNHSSIGTRDQLQIAGFWAWTARKHRHQSTLQAYSTSLSLLEQYIMVSHTIDTQQKRLTEIFQRLPLNAASYSISEGQPEIAMELLEQGRAMVWAQVGRYRSTLDRLSAANSLLAVEFRSLSMQLERSVVSTTATTDDRNASAYRLQWDRWITLLERIREEDGFSDFLKPTPFATLRQAAAQGPVIVVNINQYRSDAIIIRHTSSPIVIPLPNATPPNITSLAVDLFMAIRLEAEDALEKAKSAKIAKVLRTLWEIIVQPVVDELRNACGLLDGSRIWWCPTSSLWSLPLHAAGPYKSGSKNLPDIFISSYTPTLSALIRSASHHPDHLTWSHPQLLVVGQSQTPGQSSLPNVAEEIRQVQEFAPSVNVLNGEAATRDAVISGLRRSAWVHFACHGSQDLDRPFNSHFILYDKPLPLLDIIQTGLPNAEFAFLSACHSAAGDRRTPNEAIHLASGLQFSGFGSVIGTMWAMTDNDGPIVTREFYRYMFRNGGGAADYRDAAVGLNLATKMLRRMKVPVSRWINFIHIGA